MLFLIKQFILTESTYWISDVEIRLEETLNVKYKQQKTVWGKPFINLIVNFVNFKYQVHSEFFLFSKQKKKKHK